jgi:cellulose synthase/poly-beta-1,6-N-acetylglucosamine synthase-like glycosyltransferase/peptidoglycan/xylan/chitin deacetylase (PgdA/CDA1 family)/spore germination protein YaaH
MSTPHQHVFFDPSGRRRRVLNRATLLAGVATGVMAVVFVISLLLAPFVTPPGSAGTPARLTQGKAGSLIAPRRARVSRYVIQRSRAALAREIKADRTRRTPPGSADSIVAAFYTVWQRNGLPSLEVNAERLTHLMPEWMHLSRDGSGLDTRDFDPLLEPDNQTVMKVARNFGLTVLPILNNAENRQFDPERAALMLRSPALRRALALKVRDFVVTNGFDGVNVDFEALHAEDYPRLPAFIAELRAVLPESAAVTVDIEASMPTDLAARIARTSSFVILMAYAQNGPENDPGPLASVQWFDSVLTRFGGAIPQAKRVIGIGNYGVDWTRGVGGAALSVNGAWVQARRHLADGDSVDFDDVALNPTFVYRGDTTDTHEVWFLDAVSAWDHLLIARQHGVAGTALWLLGAEDPTLWHLYDRRLRGRLPDPTRLDTISEVSSAPVFDREEGEILTISDLPRIGVRTVDRDTSTGLLTDESIVSYASPFVIHRDGYQPGALALTFDDGPDDRWTDEILDTLKALGVRATFFVVGQNVEKYPDAVRRMVAEGHEIGNHTFTHPNMAQVGKRRVRLELNATERAIEAVTGRSSRLFRAPYNADAEPSTDAEAEPLIIASDLGYYTVGELIDPQDWRLVEASPNGELPLPRTAKQLADTIIYMARTQRANVVLLHSAGGDRSRTLGALVQIVPQLKALGYKFVTVSQLLYPTMAPDSSRDIVMARVTSRDLLLVGFDRVTFTILDLGESVLTVGFIAAIFLALLRIAWIVPLAFASRRRARREVFDPAFRPPVSVVIAAFNEATVIEQTVQATLDSEWPELEIIIVDDGSTDDTAAVVERAFAGEPRVRLVRQSNQGKAAALNTGIALARFDILVGFDADTQVEPDAIGLLARHFVRPTVAAVAGNVKVGNRVNMLTVWQSIEYITSQNLDRGAYALLNGVTVVPGAIGAWRKSAVYAVGGYVSDTLAEDMDLTFRLRRAGWRITSDAEAIGWTEAPERFRAFLRQRFRWAFGSLQVLWKHRGALLRYGWFGRLVLPSQWLFGIVFQILGPLVDLRLLYAVLAVLISRVGSPEFDPLPQLARILAQTGFFYGLFFVVELGVSLAAFRLEREDMKQLWWLFWQRFVYRQTMYYVLWRAVIGAMKGKRQGWGKLTRTGSVNVDARALPEGVGPG